MLSSTTFVYNPQSQYLFKRAYAINVGPPGSVTAQQYGTILNPPYAEAAPLRVCFEIETNMFGFSPNHSKVTLYNLSRLSRRTFQKDYLVQVYAGYNGLVGLIFTGNVFLATSERKGNTGDVATVLECLDGGSSITYARLDKSYPAGTPIYQVLSDIGIAMSLATSYNPVGVSAGNSMNIPNIILTRGFTAQGPCVDSLNLLLKPLNIEWNVLNGSLNLIPISNYIGTSTAEVISDRTGLINTPSKNNDFVQFKCLLNPRVSPGSLVELQCQDETLNGFYKIRKCNYNGDSHGHDWYVSVEAVAPESVIQTAKVGTSFNYQTATIA